MVIKVIKPRILNNEFHLEHEEKDVVEPTTKTSEDVHGGDEITQSMEDQRFAQQQSENQTQSEQQQNNNTQQQNQQNNDSNVQTEQQQNNNTQQQNQQNNDSNVQTEQQNNTQQTSENQQTEEQQNKTEDNNETNQQNNNSEQNDQQENDKSKNETNRQNNENRQTEDQDDETEEQTLDDSASDDYEEQEDEEQEQEDEKDQEETTQYNTQQAFKINEKHSIKRQLYLTFYRLVEYLSDEEKQPTLLPGPTLVLNVRKLMMRQYERKPINAYYYYTTRSQVVLILDNSGSMTWLIDELDTFFKAALKRKDVIIYVAPNGYIVSYYNDKTKRFEEISHEDAIQQIIKSSLPVIYVGDFDGADTPIELSWSTRVYWVCTEKRYKYFRYHNGVRYNENNFKGFFGRAFDDKEIIAVLKEFVKNIQKQRFWYDKNDIL